MSRFAFSDGFVKASPACQRGVKETIEALKRAGHECIEFEPPDRTFALFIFDRLRRLNGSTKSRKSDGTFPRIRVV